MSSYINNAYTNAVTNITDENQYYVYPMAASLKGGAVESEYNIRNLMSCLFNKSAAKTNDDFVLFYNKTINKKYPTLETYSENSNWYKINTDTGYCEVYDLAVGPGEGNCNGYYIRLYEHTPLTATSLNINDLIHSYASYEPLQAVDYREGDIEVVYKEGTSEIDFYKVYKDSKYFIKDTRKAYIQIELTENSPKDAHGTYVEIGGTEVIYKLSTTYAHFNVVLGLSWTTNQLVSSAQVTICNNSSIASTITNTDSDGDTTTHNYTEFGLLNKAMQDRGLLDAGIVLGTISVKKTPLYSEDNNGGRYDYRYTCSYTGSRTKTACIDLAKLGTDSENLGSNLYDKLNRLFSLMIDSGSLKIGTVINGSGFDENPEALNHDFLQGISPYRLDLGLTSFTPKVGQETVQGYLRVIDYNEENGSYTSLVTDDKSSKGYLLKCDIKVNSESGEPLGIDSLTLFDNTIQLCTGKTSSDPNALYVYGDATFDGVLNAKNTLIVDGDTVLNKKLQANDSIDIPEADIPAGKYYYYQTSHAIRFMGDTGEDHNQRIACIYCTNTDTDKAVDGGTLVLRANTTKISNNLIVDNDLTVAHDLSINGDIKNINGEIVLNSGSGNSTISLNEGTIKAKKVIGAVWA